jgi:hypothetical protein
MQLGFTKYPCFLCLWDSRAAKDHYDKIHWPKQATMNVGEYNIIILPALHIKLGLFQQFTKALDKDGLAILYMKQKFPRVGIFFVVSIKLNKPYFQLSAQKV